MAKSRMRGKNMRTHDQDNKLGDQDGQIAHLPISRTTNMPDAAQVQEVVVPSLKSSGFVVSDTEPGSTEACSGLEDARRLSDKSSSSKAEDMREWCSWQPIPIETWWVMSWEGVTREIQMQQPGYKEKKADTCNTKYISRS